GLVQASGQLPAGVDVAGEFPEVAEGRHPRSPLPKLLLGFLIEQGLRDRRLVVVHEAREATEPLRRAADDGGRPAIARGGLELLERLVDRVHPRRVDLDDAPAEALEVSADIVIGEVKLRGVVELTAV